jgi:hypothetical protein
MANAPQFSNTKVKFNRAVSNSEDNPGQQIKVSIWLNFDNGWDDEQKRPIGATPDQQKSIEDIHRQIKELNMELSFQLQEGESRMNGWMVERMDYLRQDGLLGRLVASSFADSTPTEDARCLSDRRSFLFGSRYLRVRVLLLLLRRLLL